MTLGVVRHVGDRVTVVCVGKKGDKGGKQTYAKLRVSALPGGNAGFLLPGS